jgi:GT2 family glycosyltransferase
MPVSPPVESAARRPKTSTGSLELSIVIVSWNTRELLRKCLQAVTAERETCSMEVFLVDNNSADGSAQMVASEFPWVKLIANRDNLGFAKANNQAIWLATGRKILMLNPDTELHPGCLAQLIRFLDEHPDAGVVAPQLLNTDGSIQQSCREFPTLRGMLYELFGLSRFYKQVPEFGRYKMLEFNHDVRCQVDQPQGAALLIRREVLEQVGMLDEDYFMLFEEVDWCYRVKQAGWQIWFDPAARLVHHHGQSIKQVKPAMIVSSHKGLYRYWRKHHAYGCEFIAPFVHFALMMLAVFRITAYLGKRTIASVKARIVGSLSKREPDTSALLLELPENFNAQWYREQYPDVAASGADPAIHYLKFGRYEGRLPAPPPTRDDRYQEWIEQFDRLDDSDREVFRQAAAKLATRTKISVLMPVYNVDPAWLERAVQSVINQLYTNWELCMSDDASTDPRIKPLLESYASKDERIKVIFRDTNGHISENSNSALKLATGDYVALLDCDDELAETALFWIANELDKNPDIDLIFSDEDQIDVGNRRKNPYFKSDWNPALMLSQNAFGHLGVFRRSLMEKAGGFRKGFEGSQDHDLVLRCSELSSSDKIKHIPRVLYHWRVHETSTAGGLSAKPYAWTAGAQAINEHLERRGIEASVDEACGCWYQVDYARPEAPPAVSIVIPTAFNNGLVGECVDSILEKTTYRNFDIVLLVNKRHWKQPENKPLLSKLQQDKRVKIATYNDAPFNYAAVNNFGVSRAKGSLVCFLNDDTKIIAPDWLDKMVARVMQPEVAAVGPLLLYPDDTIQHAGVILGLAGTAGHWFCTLPKGNPGYVGRAALEQDLSGLTGACLLVRREAFDAVGGFNSEFAIAFNDVDLCIRLKKAGWRLVWTPAVSLYHCESVSVGQPTSDERAERFGAEREMLRSAHADVIDADPNYNPNLSLASSECELAFPPRISKLP